MIPRIKSIKPLRDYVLDIIFDDGKHCLYDVKDDINTIKQFEDLKTVRGLFKQVQLDKSRTCVYWNDYIDLPSDILHEYGILISDTDALPDEIEAIANIDRDAPAISHNDINWD